MKKRLLTLTLACLISFTAFSQVCNKGLSGNYKIGPTGYFPTIQAAIDTLNANGVKGAVVLELQSTYTSAGETFPLNFSLIPCADSLKNITLRPETGATNLQITGNNDITIIDLNNMNWLTIDGRSGGTGSTKSLTISNTSINGSVIRYINDACFNNLKHLNIQGVTANNYNGLIKFDGTALSRGNDSNRIDTCTIFDGATPPINGIYAAGTYGKNNTGILINGCNIYNFYSNGNNSSGILIEEQTDSVTITGNSIYQTVARTYTNHNVSNVSAIRLTSLRSGRYLVANNYIGGTAPAASGKKMNLNGIFTFTGISVSNQISKRYYSEVHDNVVTNIYLGPSAAYRSNTMIELGCYNNCYGQYAFNGDCYNNNIGSTTSDTAIIIENKIDPIYSATITFKALVAEKLSGSDSINIRNNTISGIYVSEKSISPVDFYGIGASSDDRDTVRFAITDNIINNINIHSPLQAIGIRIGGSGDQVLRGSVTGNKISKIDCRNYYSNGSVWHLYGIEMLCSYKTYFTISNNNIHHLTVDENTINAIWANTTMGAAGTLSLTGNTIYAIANEQAGSKIAAVEIEGSQNNGLAVNISRNFIHSIWGLSGGNYNQLWLSGIKIYQYNSTKLATIDNNMIRLGINDVPTPGSYNSIYLGIWEPGGVCNILHNSIYIGGQEPNTNYNYHGYSACLYTQETKATRVIKNNLFVNNRTDQLISTTGFHRCIDYLTATNIANTDLDYNVYYFNSKGGGVIGFYDTTITAWQKTSGKDMHSLVANPNLKNPDGNSGNVDLHIKFPSPVDGRGSATLTTITDIDGDIRALLSPVDIGADAGGDSTKAVTGLTDLGIPGFNAAVYPNPTTGKATLFINSPVYLAVTVTVYSSYGQPVYYIKQSIMQGANTIPLPIFNSLPAGTYFLKIDNGKASTATRIIKR